MMLPAELIDHIFSFLQKDISALKACSKAHPLYSRLAERHLYAHIVIIDPRAPEVCNLILENPRLLDYPRTLEILSHFGSTRNPLAISIMPMIPRMANLVSLRISTHVRSTRERNFSQHLETSFSNHPFRNFTFPFSMISIFYPRRCQKYQAADAVNCTARGRTDFELTLVSAIS
jgi:hypothetical protein